MRLVNLVIDTYFKLNLSFLSHKRYYINLLRAKYNSLESAFDGYCFVTDKFLTDQILTVTV